MKNRDAVKEHLTKKEIPTAIHYPKPIHLQEAYHFLGHKPGDFPMSEKCSREIMSLPMHPFLTDDEQKQIAAAVAESAE